MCICRLILVKKILGTNKHLYGSFSPVCQSSIIREGLINIKEKNPKKVHGTGQIWSFFITFWLIRKKVCKIRKCYLLSPPPPMGAALLFVCLVSAHFVIKVLPH